MHSHQAKANERVLVLSTYDNDEQQNQMDEAGGATTSYSKAPLANVLVVNSKTNTIRFQSGTQFRNDAQPHDCSNDTRADKIHDSKPNLFTEFIQNKFYRARSILLPRNYPYSVSPEYMNYTKWQFLSNTLSGANGVLSMQALLTCVGLGASTAIPVAASLQWIMKDGLGQLGTILYTSFNSIKMDANPKRFRFLAALALDISTAIEIMTPLVPALFLPLAAIANLGKNISWITASATRAGIHKLFLREENMADVTAKAGSQSILSSTVGLGLGILISSYAQADDVNNIDTVLALFGLMSLGHISCQYMSLRQVALNTINPIRGEALTREFVRGIMNQERLEHLTSADAIKMDIPPAVPSPWQVAELDQFVFIPKSHFQSTNLHFGCNLVTLFSIKDKAEDISQTLELFKHSPFILTIRVSKTTPKTDMKLDVHVGLKCNIRHEEIISAYLCAILVQEMLEGNTVIRSNIDANVDRTLHWNRVLENAVQLSREYEQRFLQELATKEWVLDSIFLESHETGRPRIEVANDNAR